MEQMNSIVSFPGLGLEFELNRVAFHIGSIPVYWYGILIATGFILAILYASRRAKEFGIDADRMLDVVLGGAIGGIVGARAYFVLLRWDYYGQNLDQIFNTRSGGMAIYGGIIGGVLIGYLMCRIRKVKALPALDLAAGGFLIGQCIGRWGNFVNIEAFGGNTGLPWGMASEKITAYLTQHEQELEAIGMNIDPNMPVHPTFLYESIWCLLGFLFIAWYTKRRKFDGELILIYMMWYGSGRAVIEGLRTDSLMIPGTNLKASQVLAIVLVAAALIIDIVKTIQVKKNGKALFVDSEEGQLIVKGEFYPKKEKKEKKAKDGEILAEQTDAENPEVEKEENFPGNIESDKQTVEQPVTDNTEDYPQQEAGETEVLPEQTEADGEADSSAEESTEESVEENTEPQTEREPEEEK